MNFMSVATTLNPCWPVKLVSYYIKKQCFFIDTESKWMGKEVKRVGYIVRLTQYTEIPSSNQYLRKCKSYHQVFIADLSNLSLYRKAKQPSPLLFI